MHMVQPSKTTIQRFCLYVQAVERLAQSEKVVSSNAVAAACGLTASQVRKDFHWFGGIGKRGQGYDAGYVLGLLKQALALDRTWRAALVGTGSLARALLCNATLPYRNLDIVAVFDPGTPAQDMELGGMDVLPLGEVQDIVPALHIDIGLIATPAEQAQSAADALVRSGVSGLLCYAPVRLQPRPGVCIQSIDILGQFFELAYSLGAEWPRRRRPSRQGAGQEVLSASAVARSFPAQPGTRRRPGPLGRGSGGN